MVTATGVYFVVFSDGGIIERITIEQSKRAIIETNRALDLENERLRAVLRGYRSGKYPPDDVLQSGYINPGDRVLSYPETDHSGEKKDVTIAPYRRFHLVHMRAAWIGFSFAAISLILYFRWRSASRAGDTSDGHQRHT